MTEPQPDKALSRLGEISETPGDEQKDRFLIYGTEKSIRIDIRYQGDTLWMTQAQIAELFGRDVSVISRHIANVLTEGELSAESNLQYLQIAQSTRPVTLHSLDMIISVGYRVSSTQATRFRIWATERLKEILLRGWSIDVERMKDPESRDHLRDLKETIREIRASEKNVYREVRRICAMCQDYDPQSEDARHFYMGMQNKLLWAVTQHTGPELIHLRANNSIPNMGLTTWPNDNIRKEDIFIANNYLGEKEIIDKNRITTMLLDYFEDQVEQGRLVLMSEAERKLNEFIKFNNRPLLTTKGSVKRSVANAHAECEYALYKEEQRLLRAQTW